MKRIGLKKLLAMISCAAMLCLMISVGAVADNGLELWTDEDVLYIPLATVYYPSCTEIPDDVMEEDLVYSFSNEDMVSKIEMDYATMYQMVAPGQTEMTVQTPDGAYSDSVTIVVDPAIPVTSDSVTVYTNIRYQARSFSYVPEKSGVYELSLVFEEETMCFFEVFTSSFESMAYIDGNGTVNLDAGEMYYICPITNSDIMGDVYELQVKYAGHVKDDVQATSMMFAQSYMAVSLYDVGALPKLIFEPDGGEVYEEIEFTVEDDSILTVDTDMRNVTPLKAGYTTVTAKCLSNGWTASVVVEVTDSPQFMTEETEQRYTLEYADGKSLFFAAPATGTYVFYSILTEGDPACVVYDVQTGEAIGFGDDINSGVDFVATVDLEKDQVVMLWMYGYAETNQFEVHYGQPTAATGVEMHLPVGCVVAQDDTMIYVESGMEFDFSVTFLGGPTAMEQEFVITSTPDNILSDEYGYYTMEAGQTATFTVTTEEGLTDTVTVKAIPRLFGDINVDGEVNLLDATALFYAVNGKAVDSVRTKGAMELTGDNRITLADAARVFYYVNGLTEAL